MVPMMPPSFIQALRSSFCLRIPTGVVDKIMALKDAHVLIPRTYKYVTLDGKRAFADVIKLRILR